MGEQNHLPFLCSLSASSDLFGLEVGRDVWWWELYVDGVLFGRGQSHGDIQVAKEDALWLLEFSSYVED